MKRLGGLLVLALFAMQSAAFIPDYQMIMSRTADNHGKGVYQIEQDVVFRGDPDPLIVHEVWYIGGDSPMRVDFSGRGALKGMVQGTFIYDQSSRQWRDETGKLSSGRLSEDWAEPFFHFRNSKNMRAKMVSLKMAPAESLRDRTVTQGGPEKLDFSYGPQNFVRLSRTGGAINYAIGNPTPVEDAGASPGLWIEQDQFVVRKIRLPSTATVTASDYVRNSGGIWMPQDRVYSWGPNSAQVHVLAVRTAPQKPDIFKAASLDIQKTPNVAVKMPQQDAVREFYQKFR